MRNFMVALCLTVRRVAVPDQEATEPDAEEAARGRVPQHGEALLHPPPEAGRPQVPRDAAHDGRAHQLPRPQGRQDRGVCVCVCVITRWGFEILYACV